MNPKVKTGLGLLGLGAFCTVVYAISYLGGTLIGNVIGEGLVGVFESKKD